MMRRCSELRGFLNVLAVPRGWWVRGGAACGGMGETEPKDCGGGVGCQEGEGTNGVKRKMAQRNVPRMHIMTRCVAGDET